MISIQMRKPIIVLFILIIGIILIGWAAKTIHTSNVEAKYSTPNNLKDIQQDLTNWQNRGDEEHNTTLIKVVHLGKSDTYIAFFNSESDVLGIATMKEGPNKKLRIVNSQYGDGIVKYYGVNTDKGSYGIVIGKSLDKQIHFIRVELQNDPLKFTVQVPEDDYFITVKKLPKGVSSKKFADLYLFDKNNKEINPN
ncbi:hypothetical protein ACFVSW_21520 [Neobacillus sp. NPDC058068]|uniref:hypothetical protein n=1 Tax=Neobacillus sp. NPDC058068 TaxID=3346325 RepID=UPI0036D92980